MRNYFEEKALTAPFDWHYRQVRRYRLDSVFEPSQMAVQPTIKIEIGYRFNVRVNRDILFEDP